MQRIRIALFISILCGCSDGSDGGFTRVPARGFFQPEQLDFGERAIGETAEAEVVLTNSSAETLLFDRVVFEGDDGSAFAARTEGGDTLRGTQLARNASLPISILFGPSEERLYSAKMVVFAKELAIELEVMGRGRLVPPATPGFSPTAIFFGTSVELGAEIVKPLRVTNVGEKPGALIAVNAAMPFRVTAVGGGSPVPSLALMPGEGIDLEVRFRPLAEGNASQAIRFEMDGGGNASLPANGTAVRPATLTCDQTSIDFGSIVRGEIATRSISCTADGPYSATAIEVSAGGTAFTVENINPPIGGSGTSLTFDILFHALGVAGSRAGSIDVVSQSGARIPIGVTGQVLAPPPGSTDLRVALSWTAISTDFDLHLVRGGQLPFDSDDDCHFAAKTLDWGNAGDATDDPFLDRDDTNGPGDEELNLVSARDGFYDAYVMYFDDGAFTGPADIQIEFNLQGGAPQNVAHSMATCGYTWHVGTFDFRVSPATFTPDTNESDQWASRTDLCGP